MLYEFKFDFLRIICNHEHYIQLNLPMMRKQVKNFKGRFSVTFYLMINDIISTVISIFDLSIVWKLNSSVA